MEERDEEAAKLISLSISRGRCELGVFNFCDGRQVLRFAFLRLRAGFWGGGKFGRGCEERGGMVVATGEWYLGRDDGLVGGLVSERTRDVSTYDKRQGDWVN